MATSGNGPGTARIVLTVLIGAGLFVGLATLFAALLRPFAPARASLNGDTVVAAASATRAPPIARLSQEEADELKAQGKEIGATATSTPPRPALPDGPLVAIVMTELGPDAAAARRAIADLPPGISFTFSPYAQIAPELARSAKAEGHEIFVSIPMQPKRYPRISPGANTLLVTATPEANVRNLSQALDGFPALDGVTGMMGSAFTESREALAPVMDALSSRDLAYIDARASARSVAGDVAGDRGVPSLSNDRFVDEPATPANIGTNLDALIRTAKRRGHAVGYARATAATIDALSTFQAQAEAEGVTLVGAGRLARGRKDDG